LEEIIKNFDITDDHWLFTGCTHTKDGKNFFNSFYPKAQTIQNIWVKTVFSSPSTLTIKNSFPLFFDEDLLWRMDSDYYMRCYKRFGEPKILPTINVVNRIGNHQITNTIANREIQKREYLIMLQRYEKGFNFWYYRAIGVIRDIMKRLINH
jgi:hypothetical protein